MALKTEHQQLVVRLALAQFDAGASVDEALDYIFTQIRSTALPGDPPPSPEDIRSSLNYMRAHYDKTRKPATANREALGGALYDYLVGVGWKPPA